MADEPLASFEAGSTHVKESVDIVDGNLHVRMMRQQDLGHLVEWLSDERVLECYEGRDTHWAETDVLEHFFVAPDHDAEFLRVIIELDGSLIGYGQIYQLYDELFKEYQWPETGDVVYATDQFIGVPELWGAGIGTRYMTMVTRHIASTRGAAAILVDPRTSNERAVRCYQKAGFVIADVLPAHELHEGKLEDCYLMVYRAGNEGQPVGHL